MMENRYAALEGSCWAGMAKSRLVFRGQTSMMGHLGLTEPELVVG
jgi:hypothetical protein